MTTEVLQTGEARYIRPERDFASVLAGSLAGVILGAIVATAFWLALLWWNNGSLWGRHHADESIDIVEPVEPSGKFVTSKEFVFAMKAQREAFDRKLEPLRSEVDELRRELRDWEHYAEETRCTCRGRIIPRPGSGIGAPGAAGAAAPPPPAAH